MGPTHAHATVAGRLAGCRYDEERNNSGVLTSKLSADALAVKGQFGDTMGMITQVCWGRWCLDPWWLGCRVWAGTAVCPAPDGLLGCYWAGVLLGQPALGSAWPAC